MDVQGATIIATLLADGRGAVAFSAPNGLAGTDVFRAVLDPRVAGVTVAGTERPYIFVGTAQADSFVGIDAGDQVFGGAGVDSVTLAGG